jgi:hypothetical protein
MPLIKGKVVTPDEAMAQGCCPECGVDLKTVNPIAERASHWKRRPNNDADGEEGLRRMAMLDDFIVKNEVRTSDKPKPEAGKPPPIP